MNIYILISIIVIIFALACGIVIYYYESYISQYKERYEHRINLLDKQIDSKIELVLTNTNKHNAEIYKIKSEHQQELIKLQQDTRQQTMKQSRATLRGQATEHLAPIINTTWSHKDFRFIGNPIDYVVCAGGSAILDGESDTIDEIILLEIKTGKAKMNKIQRRIRDAIVKGKVSFAIYNTDTEEIKKWSKYENEQ